MKQLKLFFALFAMLALGVGNAWGAETDTYDFKTNGITKKSGPSAGNMTSSSSDVVFVSKTGNTTDSWTIVFTGDTYYGYGKNTGVQFGSKNYPPKGNLISSKSYDNVSQVELITTTTSKDVNMSVKVGAVSFGEKVLTSGNSTSQVFSGTPTTGAITVSLAGSSKNNIKIEKIIITYGVSSGGGSDPDEPETPTPSVSVSPASHTFATTNVGETATQVFEITAENTTETLSAEISNTTDYAISAIADNKITVTYQPQTAETHEATLTIKAGDEASATVNLSGKAVAALEGTWALVTDASSLKAGDEIIIAAKDYDVALGTTQANNNRPEVAIKKNGNTITATSEAQVLTLQAGNQANTLALYTGSGYLYAASSSSNYLRTETKLSDNSSWDISIADGTATLTAQGDFTRNTMFYNLSSKIFACYASNTTTQKAIAIYKKVDDSEVLAPGFTPTGGTFYGAQSVEITCATAGAEIYYTLDGSAPTSSSTKYTTAISISETKTLKAIAIKGENSSSVTEATYTILAPLATMQEIFDKATDATQSVHIKFNEWVISGVVPGKDGKSSSNAYITDGSKGFIIYTKDGHGFNVGNKLSGTVVCDLTRYNGSAEVVGLTSSTEGLTVTADGDVTPVEVADKSTLSGVNTGAVIKITGVCETKNVNSKDYFYVGGIQLFNSLFAYDTPTVGGKYNVTGVYLQYNDIPEILPRSADDIEEINDLTTATISIADITMEVGETKTIEATITPDAAQSTVQYAITAGNEYITLNGTTITAVAAGTATITATIAEVAGEYYGATKTFNVTVKSQNIAELPFEFTGVRADIENTLGMSQDGLGTDYTTAGVTTNLKFDGTGDWVIIHFNGQADKLAYDIKGNGFSGGKFTVQQSSDGSTYTEVVTYTELGDAATKEHVLAAESRYVKFIYTTKSSGNVGLGNITISKPDNRQEAGLAWNPETVTLTVGDAFTAPTLSNPHSVSGITYESSNEAVAAVSAEGVIALVDDAVGTATITATFDGDATYKPATVTCTIQVKSVPEDCDGSDDFTTLNPNTTYGDQETESGWTAKNAAVDTIGFIINGKTTAVGTITSPVLNGGIGSIKIRYANTYSESNGVSFQLDIKQNDAVVKTYTITKANADVVKGTVYTEVIEDINVAGDFQMVFKNLSPTKSTSNKDRVSIGRLCWTGYEEEETLVLTEGENNLTNGATGDVTVNRSFIKDNLYTLSLPFALNATQVKAMFGPNTVLYQFAKLAKEGDELVLYFSKPSAIAAGTPYLIKPSWDVNAFVVRGATITTNTNNISFTADKTTVTMKPVLSAAAGAKTNGTTEYWLAADKILYNNQNTLLSLRALFDITTTSGMPPRCRVALGENVETGVEDLFTTDAPVKVIENGQLIIIRDGVKYNVQGQKL